MGRSTATDELLEQLHDQATVLSVTRGIDPAKTLPGAAANVIEAWRELAEALDKYAAQQKLGRMPGKVIDRVTAARATIADMEPACGKPVDGGVGPCVLNAGHNGGCERLALASEL